MSQNPPFGRDDLSFLVKLFIVALLVPLELSMGPLSLPAYRIAIILLLIPALKRLIGASGFTIKTVDLALILICVWSSISIIVVHVSGFGEQRLHAIHGTPQLIEATGSLWLDTVGPYIIGRAYITSPAHFAQVIRFIFRCMFLILPFAVFELITDRSPLIEIFGLIGQTYTQPNMEPRWGFSRVQGTFAHPIHFGVFFGSLFGVACYYRETLSGTFRVVLRSVLVWLVAAMSLSSGPLVALMAQSLIVLWGTLMARIPYRWTMLFCLTLAFFVVVDLLSNRTPFHVVVEYLSFNKETAYNRLRIWTYGTQNIFDNPWFGIGFNDWVRPSWMSDSIDMFWIVGGVRHGFVVWFLWLAFFLSVFISVLFSRVEGRFQENLRIGYLVSATGLFMAGWTVHYWSNLFAYFIFFIACGLAFSRTNSGLAPETTEENQPTERARGAHLRRSEADLTGYKYPKKDPIRYTRFNGSSRNRKGN